MGWLGWTPDVALATEVGLIEMALSSRADLLIMVFGGGKKDEAKKNGKMTADDFKAFAARHNRKVKTDG